MSGWIVVVPVRRGAGAKTRLAPRPDRGRLADAFVQDAIEAVLATPSVEAVLVVSDDAGIGSALGLDESVVVLQQRVPGLNAGIGEALDAVAERWPGRPRAVLLGDVPALTPESFGAALGAAAAVDRGVVPDAAGTGTVLLTGGPGVDLHPSFGSGSAARHIAAGHAPLRADARVRQDVDSADDLAAAIALGVGRHTRLSLVPAGN